MYITYWIIDCTKNGRKLVPFPLLNSWTQNQFLIVCRTHKNMHFYFIWLFSVCHCSQVLSLLANRFSFWLNFPFREIQPYLWLLVSCIFRIVLSSLLQPQHTMGQCYFFGVRECSRDYEPLNCAQHDTDISLFGMIFHKPERKRDRTCGQTFMH